MFNTTTETKKMFSTWKNRQQMIPVVVDEDKEIHIKYKVLHCLSHTKMLIVYFLAATQMSLSSGGNQINGFGVES